MPAKKTDATKAPQDIKTMSEIWDYLSAIDVNQHVKKKQGLSYLSWAWAWGVMMEAFPDMVITWQGSETYPDVRFYPDGSAMVECTVDIRGNQRSIWLPVMDNRMNAVSNPNTRDINDAKMRCLVKCFALFGLGHYIYAGEDLPQDKNENMEVETAIRALKNKGRAAANLTPALAAQCKAAIQARDLDLLKAASEALDAADDSTTESE